MVLKELCEARGMVCDGFDGPSPASPAMVSTDLRRGAGRSASSEGRFEKLRHSPSEGIDQVSHQIVNWRVGVPLIRRSAPLAKLTPCEHDGRDLGQHDRVVLGAPIGDDVWNRKHHRGSEVLRCVHWTREDSSKRGEPVEQRLCGVRPPGLTRYQQKTARSKGSKQLGEPVPTHGQVARNADPLSVGVCNRYDYIESPLALHMSRHRRQQIGGRGHILDDHLGTQRKLGKDCCQFGRVAKVQAIFMKLVRIEVQNEERLGFRTLLFGRGLG
jgi:hypothetical protein